MQAFLIKHFRTVKKMVFLTIEPANQAEIDILSARDTTRPGPQALASWVMMQLYIRGSMARDLHLGLQNQPLTFG